MVSSALLAKKRKHGWVNPDATSRPDGSFGRMQIDNSKRFTESKFSLARLSDTEVRTIRALAGLGYSQRLISRWCRRAKNSINRIVDGRSHKATTLPEFNACISCGLDVDLDPDRLCARCRPAPVRFLPPAPNSPIEDEDTSPVLYQPCESCGHGLTAIDVIGATHCPACHLLGC